MAKPGRESVPADGLTPGAAAELWEAVDMPGRETDPADALARFLPLSAAAKGASRVGCEC